jgi:hypothetical protein
MFCVLVALGLAVVARAADWLPIAPDELQMTREDKAPKAPAIMLYRQVDRDDMESVESVYLRIKILTEEGRQYADVALPFDKSAERIYAIEARTIDPDGVVTPFDGKVYETTIAKSRGALVSAQTFTLPNIRVGSIIEYRYKHRLRYGYVFNSHWILSDTLFTRRAKFSLVPYAGGFTLQYSWPLGLPAGTAPPAKVRGRFELEARDVPAFVSEEYSPPEDALKTRVDFVYLGDDDVIAKEPVEFWRRVGKRLNSSVESFVDKRAAMSAALAGIVAADDDPETKLRKIYARVQQLRNTSFERARTEQEEQRDPEKTARNVAEVWERGYGTGVQLTWLFMALARAAGVPAEAVMVPTRDEVFFEPRMMNASQLNTNMVRIKLDGKDLFLDPGTAFTPFAALPWTETAVRCLLLDKDGGTWIESPLPTARDARVERKAALKLSPGGDLDGKLTVTYTGAEALWRRSSERNEDGAERKRMLESELKASIVAGSEVTLTNEPAWDRAEPTLVAEFTIRVPGWAAAAGHRRLMSSGLFGGGETHLFEHPVREHPLYFRYPFESVDEVAIALPAGWQIDDLPKPLSDDRDALKYTASVSADGSGLHLQRDLRVNLLLLPAKYYPTVRDFYQAVRAGDERQIVLSAAPKSAGL